jgi:hypothetical protein
VDRLGSACCPAGSITSSEASADAGLEVLADMSARAGDGAVLWQGTRGRTILLAEEVVKEAVFSCAGASAVGHACGMSQPVTISTDRGRHAPALLHLACRSHGQGAWRLLFLLLCVLLALFRAIDAVQLLLSARIAFCLFCICCHFPFSFLLVLHDTGHRCRSSKEIGVICVDVCSLYRDERLDVRRAWPKAFAQEVRYNFDKLALQARVAGQLVEAAVVADLDQLLVDELYTPLTGDFEKLNLRLDKQIEGEFGHE